MGIIIQIILLGGGLAFFMFGMNIMSTGLEKLAGGKLESSLKKMTSNPFKSLLLGAGITIAIQSSSAMTVMLVGLVNSGIMQLGQTIGVIMGSNIGTTLTAWITGMSGLEGSGVMELLKPENFSLVFALVGTVFIMFSKSDKKKNLAEIFIGFAILIWGMELMSMAMDPLKDMLEKESAAGGGVINDVLGFFSNPIIGVLVGAIVTGVIQSSAASVAILQNLAATGAVTYGMAIPIIMGQNIGTCATALISCIGANKNAKRTAFVHLYFNVIGTVVLLVAFTIAKSVFDLYFLDSIAIDGFWIAIVHSAFNIVCTVLWFPFTRYLEKLACITVRDTDEKEHYEMLDERLFATPAVAVDRCKSVAETMAEISVDTISKSFSLLDDYNENVYAAVIKGEDKVDKYEDRLGSYLVKVSSLELSVEDSVEATRLLHIINDFERISDHAVNVLQSAEEISEKKLQFSGDAKRELSVMINAVKEIVNLAYDSFINKNLDSAIQVEPLEQVVDNLKDAIKSRHIARLQKGECTIELGFVLTDLLTNLERVSDHCSNIAGCMLELAHKDLAIHEYLRAVKEGNKEEYRHYFDYFNMKYNIEK